MKYEYEFRYACDGCRTIVVTPLPRCECAIGLRRVKYWGTTVGPIKIPLIGPSVAHGMVDAHIPARQYTELDG